MLYIVQCLHISLMFLHKDLLTTLLCTAVPLAPASPAHYVSIRWDGFCAYRKTFIYIYI